MQLRIALIVCLVAVMSASVFAQRGADPVTGTWTGDWGPSTSDRNPVTVELKFDGKSAVTGTVNPGPNAITLQKGSFDPATGVLKLEADAKDRRGNAIHYVIEGKVASGSATGSWNHDARKGDFKITKK
jgi:hypothetical protein